MTTTQQILNRLRYEMRKPPPAEDQNVIDALRLFARLARQRLAVAEAMRRKKKRAKNGSR